MTRVLLISIGLILSISAFAQFDWADDGLPVRQGLHLGWNGSMIAAGSDVAMFYYHCDRDGTRDVWGQRIGSDGTRHWGLDGELLAGNVSEQRNPVVASYADGSILMVWEDYSVGRYRDLYAQRYSASGQAMWSPAAGVTVVVEPHDQYDPHVAIDENEIAYIVFIDDRETVGANVRLGAFAQVLSPTGDIRGPADGIQLVDRLWGANVPWNILAGHDNAGYALITGINGSQTDIILQKLHPNGTVAWPEDPALVTVADGCNPFVCNVNGGFAIGFTDRSVDLDGDARLLLVDLNRNPLPGWNSAGNPIAEGPETQSVVSLTETDSGDIVAVLASHEFDVNFAMLSVLRMSRTAQVVFPSIGLGTAALHRSPASLVMDSEHAVVAWSERFEFGNYALHTQKISPTGQLLWGSEGNTIWQRENKELRCDLVIPQGAAPRIAIISGRYITYPESLWSVTLTAQGTIAENPELLTGGISYNTYDPRVVALADQRALVVWSDTRSSAFRDLYYQVLDRHGSPLLAAQGEPLTSGEMNIQSAPALEPDGNGGAFVAWTGDSLGSYYMLRVQHLGPSGEQLWPVAASLEAHPGFAANPALVSDPSGGAYVFYSVYNDLFVTRTRVAHLSAAGIFDWPGIWREFDGPNTTDMTLADAVMDGLGGAFAATSVGNWTDLNIGLFHIAPDGSAGTGWTLSGREIGFSGVSDYKPALVSLDGGDLVLTFLRQNSDLATGTLRGVRVTPTGELPWGPAPRNLLGDDVRMADYQVTNDLQGGFLTAWENILTGGGARAYAARFSGNSSAVWPTGSVRVCAHEGEQQGVAIAPDGSGGAWITWEDQRDSDDYPEIDLYATHLNENGDLATVNGFSWPETGEPMCDLPTYQQEARLIPWVNGSALAVWQDLRSSNPGRCCGAGAVGDIFYNTYVQVLSEISLASDSPRPLVPQNFGITSIYPNPFNAVTTIRFELPREDNIKISVYNTIGQKIATLLEEYLSAGTHEIRWNAAAVPSGVYFIKLESGWNDDIRKLLLLK